MKNKTQSGTSLVVQWLGIHSAMQGTWVQSLVGDLRSYVPWSNQDCEPQLESLRAEMKYLHDTMKISRAATKIWMKIKDKTQNLIEKWAEHPNRHFSKMANKHMKRFLTSLVIREVQIKTTMRYPCIPCQNGQHQKDNKCWLGCAPLVGIWIGAATMEKSMDALQKVENRTTIWSSSSTSGFFIWGWEH